MYKKILMSSNITLRNKPYKCIINNFLLNLKLYNKQNFLLTITIIFFKYSLLTNITDNKHGLLRNIKSFVVNPCMLSLSVTSTR